MPMTIAALEQVLDWQPERVQEYCRVLTAPLVERVRTLGYTVEDPAFRGAHLFGLRAPAGTDITAIADRLRARKVYVSLRGSAIRVSPHVYNDAARRRGADGGARVGRLLRAASVAELKLRPTEVEWRAEVRPA